MSLTASTGPARPRPLRPSRRHVHVALAALTLATLAACGSADTDEASAAAPEGALTVYNGRSEELVGPLFEQFTEATGIPVELRSASSGELAAQLLTEAEASPADVFVSQDAGALGALTKAGLFAALPDELLDRVDPAFRAEDGTWLGLSGRVRVVTYNADEVTAPPDTIDEVVAGDWAGGKIGYAPTNASWQSFVTGLRVLRGEEAARAWLEQFAAQDPVAFEGNSQVRDAVDAGEVQIGLVNHYYLYELIEEKGEDAVRARNQFMAPGDPGGLVNVAGVGVLGSSDDAERAETLVDWLAGPTAQAYFATQTWEYPLVAGVDQPEGLPALDELEAPALDLSDLDSIAETQALLAEVGLLTQ
ncbi:MAG: iron ABC transporter substrate-binding protein [Candidatus Nanopelagicales bacterium]|nr:iron ABC transporter substrate-binding protein [Candidatus Nanopelagicales bacterium]